MFVFSKYINKVVATELPEHLKEVAQVKDLKVWAFQFICFMIFKDICATIVWWPTTYWDSGKIAEYNPWNDINGNKIKGERLTDGFYAGEAFPWWHRIWFMDGMLTIMAFGFWLHQFLVLCVYPRTNWETQQTAAVVRFEANKTSSNLLKTGSYLRHFILERAANFLHDRWRSGYAQQCKRVYIANQREKQKKKDAGKETPSALRSPFHITTGGRPNIERRASAMWLNEQLGNGLLEIPPRWKSETTFQSPPTTSNPPTTKNHGGIGAPGRWYDKNKSEWYVNIDQKLDKLPESAMVDNLKSADDVIKMLEQSPHAPRTTLADNLHRIWLNGQDLSEDDKLHKPWAELATSEKNKNMVIINAVNSLHILCTFFALEYTTNTFFLSQTCAS